MKKVFLLLVILSFLTTNAQYSFGRLYFKDGSHKMGFIKVKANNTIKFKKENNQKPTIYDHTKILGFNNDQEYEYVTVKQKPIILKVETKGKINLYSNMVAGVGHWSPNGGYIGGGSRTVYYIKSKDDIILSNGRLRKKYDYLIDDCSSLIKKINSRKIKRTQLLEIIKVYNKDCNK